MKCDSGSVCLLKDPWDCSVIVTESSESGNDVEKCESQG